MDNLYKYIVSFIIPVYNKEKYIARCLNSILSQDFNQRQIQIVIVDNCSTDNSKKICLDYAYEYENIEVYTEARQGVSYARNTAMKAAEGKYLMFLDSDDYISDFTVSNVISFFENHEELVDLVAYHEIHTENGVVRKDHIRYQTLTHTGIYDLHQAIYSLQVRLNVCIKNDLKVKFDEEMNFQEDQKFCSEILGFKFKLGYVREAEYYYDIQEEGLVSKYCGPLNYFESTTRFFEQLFGKYAEVPPYFQGLFIHDCIWKFKANRFWPYHYGQDDFILAKKRIYNLLCKVNDETILSYPDIDIYEKLYWLKLKDKEAITCYVNTEGVKLIKGDFIFYQRVKLEIILKKILIVNNRYKIRGFLKSVAFDFFSKPVCYAIVNGAKYQLSLKDCASGYYKVKEKTNTFWGFEIEGDINTKTINIQFQVIIDGIQQQTEFFNTPQVAFSDNNSEYIVEDLLVEQKEDSIVINRLDEQDLIYHRIRELRSFDEDAIKSYKMESFNRVDDNIWLYNDAPSVLFDNAYLQFLHDIKLNDGIDRYYIITNENSDFEYLANGISADKLVKRGSNKHIALFFKSKKVLTSFVEEDAIWPFNSYDHKKAMRGVFNAEIIYLQHGILHAHLPWYYSKFVNNLDRFVISTEYEKENLILNYDYDEKDLLLTGMARYDLIDTNKPENRILFAPSWRSYLVNSKKNNELVRVGNDERFEKSNYYLGIINLLSNADLIRFLEEYDLFIDLKLHPEFNNLYSHTLNNITNHRIKIINGEIVPSKYKCLVTDFSSMLYDFVYIKRPIIYFVPDYLEFLSGINHYRQLDICLDDGFGYFTVDYKDVVKKLSEMVQVDFKIEDGYIDKYESFIFSANHSRASLYEKLTT